MSFNPRPPQSNATSGEMAANLQYGGDPRSAMINAILNSGGNPFKSSPFMKMLLQTAPGLQATHMLSNIGAKPNDIGGMGGEGQMFGDFLKSSLAGGNIYGQLRGAASNLPNYVNQLRDYQSQVKDQSIQGPQISPFAAALEEMLGDAGGMGKLLTSLYAPSLGALAQPWASGLQDSLAGATNRMANDFSRSGDPLNPPNFFDYIFGRG